MFTKKVQSSGAWCSGNAGRTQPKSPSSSGSIATARVMLPAQLPPETRSGLRSRVKNSVSPARLR